MFGLVLLKSERKASRPRVGDGGTRDYQIQRFVDKWYVDSFVDKQTFCLDSTS